MSGLCGWLGAITAPAAAEETIASMSRELSRFDATPAESACGPQYGLAVAATAGRAHLARAQGCVAALWGRPTFEGLDTDEKSSDARAAHALIGLYRQHGTNVCGKLRGAFALALVDEHNGEGLLAIDRMGVHNLAYRQSGEGVVFGSTMDAIARHPTPRAGIDWQSMYNYVHFHMVPGPATIFDGVRRLSPGQCLVFRNAAPKLHRYWSVEFAEDETQPFERLRDEFLSILTESVRTMSADQRTGAFLSGGTDSSTIAGLLGKVSARPAETFSIGFDEQGYDEMAFARIAARHFGTSQHEYYVTARDIVETLPKLAAIYDQPFGNSSAVPTYCCARFARENGMSVLLGGDGGDELFGGNERYSTQRMYGHYGAIPAVLRRGLLEPVARALKGGESIKPIRQYRRLIELVSMPMPDRMEAFNLLTRFGAGNIFTPDFLARVDPDGPSKLMREVYERSNAGSLINRMLAYDFQFTLADNDLPKVVKSCELAGLPVDFPMLDDRLVAFSARLAPDLKLRGRTLRYFFKESLRGFLPDEIIAKTKHGFGLPFGPWMRTYRPLEELAMDTLGRLRKRGIVRDDFLDKLIGTHIAEHPGYFGTMAWVLIMLELWLQAHAREAA